MGDLNAQTIKIKLKAYRDQADRPSHKYNRAQSEGERQDQRLQIEETPLKDLINHTDDQDHKARPAGSILGTVNRQVKRSARNDKRNFINDLTEEAENSSRTTEHETALRITRTLSGKNNNPTRPVKDKNGQIITKEEDQRTRWAEHFKETLNRPPPPVPPDIPPTAQLLDISTNPPTKTEIIKAIKSLKSGKAAGPDGIPPEALKADIQTSTDMLHPLLRKIWESARACHKTGRRDTWIILERLKTALDKTLREEQAGFRNDPILHDHIATMRIIIEQSLEWQTPLYSTFVDFPEGEKLNRVAEEAEKTGLKINISKTEVMRVNHKQHDPIQLHQEDIKEVDKFIYLGSVVSKDGGTDEDIKSAPTKPDMPFALCAHLEIHSPILCETRSGSSTQM
nr:hypothetical protein BaRGS_006590 [Batillaria attramentaria]